MAGNFDRPAVLESLLQDISKSFNNPSYDPDITIACNGQQWLCHKNILRASSQWFATASSSGFAERTSKIITLEEDEDGTAAVEAVLRYSYTLSLTDSPHLLFYARVFALAQKYFVNGLAELATDHFTTDMGNTTTEDFAAAIKYIYLCSSDTSRMLKDKIVAHMLKHRRLLDGSKEEFNNLLLEVVEFGADMIKVFASKPTPSRNLKCKWPESEAKTYRCPCGRCHLTFKADIPPGGIYLWDRCAYNHPYHMTGQQWESYALRSV